MPGAFEVPFAIRPGPHGWTWRAEIAQGASRTGGAPTRAAAAACVIRVLSEAAAAAGNDPGRRVAAHEKG